MVSVRPPSVAEFEVARRIVRDAGLDPTTPLHFEHTLIADADGQVVGVGQIKHQHGYQELGSLVVLPEYRGQGVAGKLIEALEDRAERPLYLTCLQPMLTFYDRFGYQQISYGDAPPSLRHKLRLTILLRLVGMRVCVMRKG